MTDILTAKDVVILKFRTKFWGLFMFNAEVRLYAQ